MVTSDLTPARSALTVRDVGELEPHLYRLAKGEVAAVAACGIAGSGS